MFFKKGGFTMVNRSSLEIDSILKQVIDEAESVGIKVGNIHPSVKSTRGTKQFGRCEKKDGVFTICLSKYYKDNDLNDVKQILMHEVLHTVEGCFNHGVKWKNAAYLVNKKFGYDISRTDTFVMANLTEEEEAKFYKYVIKCTDCGHITYRQRKSKLVTHTHHYKCKCGGQLELQ